MSSVFDPNVASPTVGALLRLAWQTFRARLYAAAVSSGYADLQPAQIALFRYPTIANMRPGQLAEEAGISKQAANDLLRQLEARGYLELRPDPEDGRARLITLTSRGSDLMEFLRSAAAETSREWARAVGIDRYEALHETLLQLVQWDRPTKAQASPATPGNTRRPGA